MSLFEVDFKKVTGICRCNVPDLRMSLFEVNLEDKTSYSMINSAFRCIRIFYYKIRLHIMRQVHLVRACAVCLTLVLLNPAIPCL